MPKVSLFLQSEAKESRCRSRDAGAEIKRAKVGRAVRNTTSKPDNGIRLDWLKWKVSAIEKPYWAGELQVK
jgi:hypothetical protein